MNQRIRLTKQLLQEALVESIHTKSIRQVSVREVCEHAEVNRSTFYLHYRDIYDLMEETERTLLKNLENQLKHIHVNPLQIVYLESLLRIIRDEEKMFSAFVNQPYPSHFKKDFMEMTLNHLEQDLDFSEESIKKKYVLEYLLEGHFALIQKWIEEKFDLPIPVLAKLLYDLSASTLKYNELEQERK